MTPPLYCSTNSPIMLLKAKHFSDFTHDLIHVYRVSKECDVLSIANREFSQSKETCMRMQFPMLFAIRVVQTVSFAIV